MTVGFRKPRDPRNVPSFTLWTLLKDEHTREARTRLLPIIDGCLELTVYEGRGDGSLDLLWSRAGLSGDEVNTLAKETKRQYEVEGWRTACEQCDGTGWVCEAHPIRPLNHLRAESRERCDGAGMPCECAIGQALEAMLDDTYRNQR